MRLQLINSRGGLIRARLRRIKAEAIAIAEFQLAQRFDQIGRDNETGFVVRI